MRLLVGSHVWDHASLCCLFVFKHMVAVVLMDVCYSQCAVDNLHTEHIALTIAACACWRVPLANEQGLFGHRPAFSTPDPHFQLLSDASTWCLAPHSTPINASCCMSHCLIYADSTCHYITCNNSIDVSSHMDSVGLLCKRTSRDLKTC